MVQPFNKTVNEGSPVTFSVQAINGTLSYQWKRNGQNITVSGNNAGYTLPAVSVTDDGATFQCIVSNEFGSTPSDIVTLTVNTLPVFGSHPTAVPGAATVGQTVQFSAMASGAHGQALTYAWDFGDGGTATGDSVTHAFNSVQNFVVTVTATDTLGASATETLTIYIFIDGNGDMRPDLDPDADNDPYIDATTALDNLPVKTLAVTKMAIALSFKKIGKDTMTVTGTLPIPIGFLVENKPVVVIIGGVGRAFTMTIKNKGTALPNGTFQLTYKKKTTVAQTGKFTFKLAKAELKAVLAGPANLKEVLAKKEPRPIRATIFFDGAVHNVVFAQIYTAKPGATGKTVNAPKPRK